jgi:hypothetical protein
MAFAPETLAQRRGNRPKVTREAAPAIPTGDAPFAHLIDKLDGIAADAEKDAALARFLGSTLSESKAKAIAANAKKPIEIFRKGGADAMAWLAVAQLRTRAPKTVTRRDDTRIEPRHGGGWWGGASIPRGLLVDPRCAVAVIGDYKGWSVCPGSNGVLVVTGDLEAQGITMFGELRVLGTLRCRYINNTYGTIVVGADAYTLSIEKGIIVDGPLHVGNHAKVPAEGVHPNQIAEARAAARKKKR